MVDKTVIHCSACEETIEIMHDKINRNITLRYDTKKEDLNLQKLTEAQLLRSYMISTANSDRNIVVDFRMNASKINRSKWALYWSGDECSVLCPRCHKLKIADKHIFAVKFYEKRSERQKK